MKIDNLQELKKYLADITKCYNQLCKECEYRCCNELKPLCDYVITKTRCSCEERFLECIIYLCPELIKLNPEINNYMQRIRKHLTSKEIKFPIEIEEYNKSMG